MAIALDVRSMSASSETITRMAALFPNNRFTPFIDRSGSRKNLYLMPECAMEFMTRDCRIMNRIRLGMNMISVAAAVIP